jgi:hypothetical protein
MKKTLLSLVAMMALGAQAQTAVVAPDQPTIPTMATVSPNAVTALGSATTNRVFIDQSGSTPTVNMTQNGSGNAAGSATGTPVVTAVKNSSGTGTNNWTLSTPVYLRGDNQIVTTVQNGNNNRIGLALVNDAGANGAKVTIQQIGNSNTSDVACGYGTSSTGTALSGCNKLDMNVKFAGDSNHLQYRGTGNDISTAIDVAGNGNAFFMDIVGNKHTQTIKVTGDDNVFNVTQTSTGANGSSIWVDQTGTGTKFTIAQTGTIDNVLNLKSVASGGSFNITQKN